MPLSANGCTTLRYNVIWLYRNLVFKTVFLTTQPTPNLVYKKNNEAGKSLNAVEYERVHDVTVQCNLVVKLVFITTQPTPILAREKTKKQVSF